MSWLMVSGMIYHCLQCGKSLKVDYEGGASLTQVGEDSIFNYCALEDKYHSNQEKDPLHEGIYLHDEGICGHCIDGTKILTDDTLQAQGQLTRAEAADVLYRAQQGTTNEVLPGQSPTSSVTSTSQPSPQVPSGGQANGNANSSEQQTVLVR